MAHRFFWLHSVYMRRCLQTARQEDANASKSGHDRRLRFAPLHSDVQRGNYGFVQPMNVGTRVVVTR
jgi:hypothetical protein